LADIYYYLNLYQTTCPAKQLPDLQFFWIPAFAGMTWVYSMLEAYHLEL